MNIIYFFIFTLLTGFYSAFTLADSSRPYCEIALGELVWKNRVLIYKVQSKSELDNLYAFAEYEKAALSERKLVVIGIVEQQPIIVFGYPICNVSLGKLNPETKVTLIGLDSKIKAEYDTFDSYLIYSMIDQMPMRKTELGSY
ncbi:DUF4174 domain-containing protein [Alteromonas sp. ALT199]|uniref:DUF4174 domain-containing protein n=1 Tax=unclassified Alteromonas TaxID=2614992 RepID=UPI001BE6B5C8|nr:DUF4174 domain-containing protein [Alteromonas sp. ALT199]MBT3134070.1 DUF4174 domain-containing protein [Alteromonas sp. ALT199]